LTALDSTYNPLKTKAIHKWVREPLFNMKGSNPRQIHLDRGMLNGSRKKSDKEAKCPFVCWAWGP